MSSPRTVLLFDIDGTLLLTGGAGQVAFERAFRECFGVDDSWGSVVPDGKTDPVIFREIARVALNRELNDEEYGQLCGLYLDYFPEALRVSERFRLMPGVAELLPALRSRGEFLLGVATGNFERAAWDKLRRASLEGYFGFGGFGSDSAKRAELVFKAIERARRQPAVRDLEPNDFVVIGDTPLDIAAARANGARVVAVATGSYSVDQLAAHGADLVVEDFSEPRRLWDYLTGR